MIVTFLGYLHLHVFSTVVSVDCSNAVSLLQVFFVRESVVSYVAFILLFSSFVPRKGIAS